MATQQGDAGRREFPAFPFPPYSIQLGFMRALYSALEQGGVGLFESPTGTGKTVSLICSSLQWLQDQRQREAQQAAAKAGAGGGGSGREGAAEDDDEPEWMRDFGALKDQEHQQQLLEQQKARVARAKTKLHGGGKGGGRNRRQGAAAAPEPAGPDAEFLLGDWESGDEGGGGGSGARKRSPGAASLGSSASGSESEEEGRLGEGEEPELPRKTQIIFASRTHSQLSQFVGELNRTPFADTMSLVALGSRKALCINDAVLKLQSSSLVNERCLEMQKPGGSSGGAKKQAAAAPTGAGTANVGPQRKPARRAGRCPFLASGSQAAETTRDLILAQPIDIEELARLGRRKSVCPYYSARRALPEADIVLVPYSALLARETQEALGLRLEGTVLIIDEAHNLVDAVNSAHSAELSGAQAATAARQLGAYLERFRARLAPGNCRQLQTLQRVAGALAQAAAAAGARGAGAPAAAAAAAGGAFGGGGGGGGGVGEGSGVVRTVNAFLFDTGLDNINMFKLVSYVRESKAAYKVAGFWQSHQQQEGAAHQQHKAQQQQQKTSQAEKKGALLAAAAGGGAAAPGAEGSTGALHALVGFLQALTNDDADGRIIVQPAAALPQQQQQAQRAGSSTTGSSSSGPNLGQLRFVLLNAAAHFARVVSAAHAVVLASGTLSPLESVLHLFPDTPPHQLHHYSCGHVVPKDRLLALAVGAGPSGRPLDFRHAARSAPATIDELGRLLSNVCQGVPGGVVVFFPSFTYADQVYARWEQSGMLRTLATRKRVFREPRSAGEVEQCLAEYARCIEQNARSSKGGGNGCSGSSIGGEIGGSNPPASSAIALDPGSLGAAASAAGASAGKGGSAAGAGAAVAAGSGAVMLCVVGGKLAEGINFGDSLGRCVVMVGLPYPSPSDPELQERMRFMDASSNSAASASAQHVLAAAAAQVATLTAAAVGVAGGPGVSCGTPPQAAAATTASAAAGEPCVSSSMPAAAAGGAAPSAALQHCRHQSGRDYYTGLCMKAVNQCVGRVIRHQGDWAAILLLDARYAAAVDAQGRFTGPLAQLPGWIQQSLSAERAFGEAFGKLARFCKGVAAADAAAAAGAAAATLAL